MPKGNFAADVEDEERELWLKMVLLEDLDARRLIAKYSASLLIFHLIHS